jgi:hypothetical protein
LLLLLLLQVWAASAAAHVLKVFYRIWCSSGDMGSSSSSSRSTDI